MNQNEILTRLDQLAGDASRIARDINDLRGQLLISQSSTPRGTGRTRKQVNPVHRWTEPERQRLVEHVKGMRPIPFILESMNREFVTDGVVPFREPMLRSAIGKILQGTQLLVDYRTNVINNG